MQEIDIMPDFKTHSRQVTGICLMLKQCQKFALQLLLLLNSIAEFSAKYHSKVQQQENVAMVVKFWDTSLIVKKEVILK